MPFPYKLVVEMTRDNPRPWSFTIELSTDKGAVDYATKVMERDPFLRDAYALNLWCDTRRVARFTFGLPKINITLF